MNRFDFKIGWNIHSSLQRVFFVLFLFVVSQVLFFTSESFKIRCIEVDGIKNLTGEQVAGACQLSWDKYIWDVDTRLLHDRILSVAWVDNVSLKKIYPAKLLINVKEREPVVAISDISKRWYGVDEDGRVLLNFVNGRQMKYPRLITNEVAKLNSSIPKSSISSVLAVDELLPDTLKKDVKSYSVNVAGQLSFIYVSGGREITIKIGTMKDLESKIDFFGAIVKQLGNKISVLEYIDLRHSEPVIKHRSRRSSSSSQEDSDSQDRN